MTQPTKEGDLIPVWWSTGKRNEQGDPLARVLSVYPYAGRYPQCFNVVLCLHAPNTRSGRLEMAYDDQALREQRKK